jgi:hypothetical protein
MQKVQGQKPALEETRNRKVSSVFFLLLYFQKVFDSVTTIFKKIFLLLHTILTSCNFILALNSLAATDSFHLTKLDVLQGEKVPVLDKRILASSCSLLQKGSHYSYSEHFHLFDNVFSVFL